MPRRHPAAGLQPGSRLDPACATRPLILPRSVRPEPGPRERLLASGPEALSEVELLQAVLGSGTATRSARSLAETLLRAFGSLRGVASSSIHELQCVSGVGLATASRLAAVGEFGRRVAAKRWRRGTAFESSAQVFEHVQTRVRDDPRERFLGLFLDVRHRLIAESEISCGTLVASLVHPREVFRPAIRLAAAGLLVVHNHPSGDPTVSAEDIAVTRRLHEVGRLLGIPLIDHVVVGEGQYTSFVDRGIEPFSTGEICP